MAQGVKSENYEENVAAAKKRMFKSEVREAYVAAKQLGYDKKYLQQIENAQTRSELSRIMATARADRFKD